MGRGIGIFALAMLGCWVLFGLLTASGTLPLLLVPVWVIGGVVLLEARRRRLYNKPCPHCGVPLLRALKGGVGAPEFCRECLTVVEWDDELQPLDTGEKLEER